MIRLVDVIHHAAFIVSGSSSHVLPSIKKQGSGPLIKTPSILLLCCMILCKKCSAEGFDVWYRITLIRQPQDSRCRLSGIMSKVNGDLGRCRREGDCESCKLLFLLLVPSAHGLGRRCSLPLCFFRQWFLTASSSRLSKTSSSPLSESEDE